MKPTVLAAGTLLLAGSLALAAWTTASAQGFKISKPEIVFDEQTVIVTIARVFELIVDVRERY